MYWYQLLIDENVYRLKLFAHTSPYLHIIILLVSRIVTCFQQSGSLTPCNSEKANKHKHTNILVALLRSVQIWHSKFTCYPQNIAYAVITHHTHRKTRRQWWQFNVFSQHYTPLTQCASNFSSMNPTYWQITTLIICFSWGWRLIVVVLRTTKVP